jgi:hypothetical protein
VKPSVLDYVSPTNVPVRVNEYVPILVTSVERIVKVIAEESNVNTLVSKASPLAYVSVYPILVQAVYDTVNGTIACERDPVLIK